MVINKSLDDSIAILCTLLHDVQNAHEAVFNTRALRLTQKYVRRRAAQEGIGFLTKTLPRLGKAFDKAISGSTPLNCSQERFQSLPGTQLPRFLGELFQRVLQPNGTLLQESCAQCVRSIRQVCYLFYKYKLPYLDEQEQQVISAFENAENDLSALHPLFQSLELWFADSNNCSSRSFRKTTSQIAITRKARVLLNKLFSSFDPLDIHPRHGPGAVATKQKLSEKYLWTNVSANITRSYPFDAYFCASQGHVCDTYDSFKAISEEDLPARVCLVPKDSRGPRLISCEPVDYQWVQQGLSKRIVELVESHNLTKHYVHFTHQVYNRIGAIHGSKCGKYCTLDLKEASDRVSLELVHLLFPSHVYTYLESCRSSSTVLPSGKVLKLNKFAPMGSSLCFPILALTIWAILTAAAPDADTRDSILVYGDDVIVPTAFAANAIEQLESFGLKVNRDKSCTSGLFRESCGMDAFNGVEVTPVRLRTVWSSEPGPDVYTSWIAYANSFWDRRYYRTYELIAGRLHSIYGVIPSDDMHLACPSLRYVPESLVPKRRRVNSDLQRLEWHVRTVSAPTIKQVINGWSMLLRFFAERGTDSPLSLAETRIGFDAPLQEQQAFSVSQYTSQKSSRLVKRWLTPTITRRLLPSQMQ